MKKLSTALCLSSILLAPFAVQAWEGNWLVGVFGSYAEREKNAYLSMFDATGFQTVYNTELNKSGSIWGLLGGYQFRCHRCLFGLELNLAWDASNTTNDFAFTDFTDVGWDATAKYKRDYSVGLSGRAGFDVFSFFFPYVRLGVEFSKDKVSYDATSTTALTIDASGSRTVYRGIAGIGAEFPIKMFPALSIRAEYDFHSKGRGVDAVSSAANAAGSAAVDFRMKERINEVQFALIWNFIS